MPRQPATLCGGFNLILGHIQTASATLAGATGSSCQTYSTADETVQQCRNDNANFEVAEGENLGTVGAPSIGAFDLGIYDQDGANFFVNPSRYSTKTLTAVCPYDLFAPTLKAQLYSMISDGVFSASGTGVLSIRKVAHAAGASPCNGDPSTWSMSGSTQFVR